MGFAAYLSKDSHYKLQKVPGGGGVPGDHIYICVNMDVSKCSEKGAFFRVSEAQI